MRFFGIFSLVALVMLVSAGSAFAQLVPAKGGGEMVQIVVDTFALLFLLLCSYIAMELRNILKGGELASSWMVLIGAVVIFALIKIIEVAGRAGYFEVPDILISIGYLIVSIFLLIGFLKQKKTLG